MLNWLYLLLNNVYARPILFFGTFFVAFTTSYAILSFLGFLPETTSASEFGTFDPTTIIFLGVLAGGLQLLGYIFYIRNEDIDPNPVTWFMFAYGTLVLAVLEWDIEATFAELILPTVCGLLAIVVSVRCWLHARKRDPSRWWPEDWWPDDIWDRFSLISDISITIGYILAWILATYAILSVVEREWAVLTFLFLSNLSTFPAFYPILHSTFTNPEREHWLPWMVWSAAYAVLALVTYSTHNAFWHALMFYPVSNAFLHALVGFIALYRNEVVKEDKISIKKYA